MLDQMTSQSFAPTLSLQSNVQFIYFTIICFKLSSTIDYVPVFTTGSTNAINRVQVK